MESFLRHKRYIRKNVFIAQNSYLESLEIASKLGMKYPEYLRHLISEDILEYRSLSYQIQSVANNDPRMDSQYISYKKKMEILQIMRLLRKIIDDSTQ